MTDLTRNSGHETEAVSPTLMSSAERRAKA